MKLCVVAILALVSLVTVRARAEVSLVPAHDGYLGALLVAGPLGRVPESGGARPEKGTAVGGVEFRLLHAADGAFDLDRALGAGRRAGARALAGGELDLSEDLEGWLLLSADGPVGAWVDGKRVFSRDLGKLRGSAWDASPLTLPKGRHTLVIELEHPGAWWALELRVLDARDLSAPRGLVWRLPGTTDSDAAGLERRLLTASLDAGLGADGYRPRLRLEYRRGGPPSGRGEIELGVRAGKASFDLRAGRWIRERGTLPLEIGLPPILPSDLSGRGKLTVDVLVDGTRQRLEAPLDPSAPGLLARAEAASRAVLEGKPKVLDAVSASTTLAELSRSLPERSDRARALEHWLDEIEAGRDPLRGPGLVSLFRRSPVDAEPDPVVVHVPARFSSDPSARFPLVVALHGLNGTPERILDAFLDSKSPGPSVDGFVVAPYAHGNAFYRGPGELEVMGAVDWMLATYPIDRDRVSITGVSMGGTGTAHLALRYADRFSRAAPLCGYHSFFVRRDTANRPIRSWERERMHHWSPASWAERGSSLPMWVAHGTKDFPLDNSKVLVERYRQLGYSMTDEWPDTGHDVWTKAYAGARLWPWLSRGKRDPSPRHVVVKTDSLRYGKLAWARITRLGQPGHMGLLDAERAASGTIVVRTDSVGAFELEQVPANRTVEVVVDGQKLGFAEDEKISLTREADGWKKGLPPAVGKRAGIEGPIRDAYLEPLLFTFGALDPRTTRANREVARAFAKRHGPEVGYRVIPDSAIDDELEASHALFVVGTPRDHRLLAAISESLPIRVEAGALRVGSTEHRAPGTGAIFIFPNPRHPDRYVVVVTGVDAAGIWRALSLPQLLPDFLVYDAALEPAAAEIILGSEARVLAGGFFDQDWKLPTDMSDH